MQLKMDSSSDQLATAVSEATPTLAVGVGDDDTLTTTATTATSQHTGSQSSASSNGDSVRSNGTLKSSSTTVQTVTATASSNVQTSPAATTTQASREHHQPQQQPRRFSGNPTFPAQSSPTITSGSASMPLRILVLKDLVGAIIGRGGGTIKQITQDTHAKVDVHRKEHSTANENVIMIYGTPEACTSACKRIVEVMQEESRALNRPDEVILKILAPNSVVGRVIGKSGATIKRIMTQTDTKISVSSANLVSQYSNERTILISGSVEAMTQAEAAISAKLRQCFENDFYAHIQSMAGVCPTVMPLPPNVSGLLGPSAAAAASAGVHPSSTAYFMASASLPQHSSRASQVGPGPSGSSSGSATANTSSTVAPVPSNLPGVGVGAPVQQFSSPYYPNPYMRAVPAASPYFPSSFAASPIPGFYGSFGAPPPSMVGSSHSMGMGAAAQQQENVRETVSLFIPNSVVGAIIGRGGQTIRDMIAQSTASIKVAPVSAEEDSPLSSLSSPPPTTSSQSGASTPTDQQHPPHHQRPTERRVIIVGNAAAQYYAQNLIYYHVICELYQQQHQQQTKTGQSSSGGQASGQGAGGGGFYGDKSMLRAEIHVPNNVVRRIIGRHGSVIQELQRQTGTIIKLAKERDTGSEQPTPGDGSESDDTTPVHIIGEFAQCYMAQRQIRSIVARAQLGGGGPVTYGPSTLPSQPQQQPTSTTTTTTATSGTKESSAISSSSSASASQPKPSQTATATAASASGDSQKKNEEKKAKKSDKNNQSN